jgi:hypothetical protein
LRTQAVFDLLTEVDPDIRHDPQQLVSGIRLSEDNRCPTTMHLAFDPSDATTAFRHCSQFYRTYMVYLRATSETESRALAKIPHLVLHFLYFCNLRYAQRNEPNPDPLLHAGINYSYEQLRVQLVEWMPSAICSLSVEKAVLSDEEEEGVRTGWGKQAAV